MESLPGKVPSVWNYWVAQRAHKPHLASTVLVLLSLPYGSSDAERSLRKANKTSNNKHRGAKMDPAMKGKVNFIYTNAPLQLTNLASRKRAAPVGVVEVAAPIAGVAALDLVDNVDDSGRRLTRQ